MPWIVTLPLTILVGVSGGIICKKKKLFPAAYMIGAFLFVVVLSLATSQAYFPARMRVFTRALVGAHLGMRLRKEQMAVIAKKLPSITAVLVCLFITMLITGGAAHVLGGMPLETALYAFAPGGVSDMAIIAEAAGADFVPVSIIQLVRLVAVFLYYPALYGWFLRKGILKVAPSGERAAKEQAKQVLTKKEKRQGALLVITLAAAGAFTGELLGIPGGALTFSMLFVCAANMITTRTYVPPQVSMMAQILSGVYLGAQFTRGDIAILSTLLVPFIVLLVGVATLPILSGYAVHKLTGMNLATALFCCTPGGMAEMTLMADDIGLDIAEVSVTHIVRITVVVAVFPQIIKGIMLLFGG